MLKFINDIFSFDVCSLSLFSKNKILFIFEISVKENYIL